MSKWEMALSVDEVVSWILGGTYWSNFATCIFLKFLAKSGQPTQMTWWKKWAGMIWSVWFYSYKTNLMKSANKNEQKEISRQCFKIFKEVKAGFLDKKGINIFIGTLWLRYLSWMHWIRHAVSKERSEVTVKFSQRALPEKFGWQEGFTKNINKRLNLLQQHKLLMIRLCLYQGNIV